MADRSELALQLAAAVAGAHAAVGRSTDRAFHSYGLSHRAHQALCAVDEGGPGGARPKDVAEQLGVSRAAATTFIQRLGQRERRLAARAIEGMPASGLARAVSLLHAFKRRLDEKQIQVVT